MTRTMDTSLAALDSIHDLLRRVHDARHMYKHIYTISDTNASLVDSL